MSVRDTSTRDRLFDQVGGVCVYCLTRPADHLDHIRPKSRHGPNALANLAPACRPCGESKRNMSVIEWALNLAAQVAAGESPEVFAASG